MKYIANAFSLQMLDNLNGLHLVSIKEINPAEIPQTAKSIIGHKDTATVVSNILGFPVEFNRESVKIHDGDTLYVAQVTGGRLPEGATILPAGITIQFVKVTIA